MTGPLSSLMCCKSRIRTASFSDKPKSGPHSRPPLEIAHSILREHNLPYGLMPMGSLLSCDFSPSTGRLAALQPQQDCECEFGGHWIKFEMHISCTIAKNMVRDLKGVKVKCCFVWLAIKSIDVDPVPGGKVHFHVGPFSASIPAQELWDYRFWPDAFRSSKGEEAATLSPQVAIEKALRLLSPRSRKGCTPERLTPA